MLLSECLLQEKQTWAVFVAAKTPEGDFAKQKIKLHSMFTVDELNAGSIMGFLHIENAVVW